jgi:hypothetical protein
VFPALTILSTIGLTHSVFATLEAASVRATPFAQIDQGATAAIAAIVIVVVIVVVVVVVVIVIAAGDEEE